MHLVLFSCIGFWKVGPGGCFAPFLSTKCMNNWIVECHWKIPYCYVFPFNQNSPNGSTWMYSNKWRKQVYNLFAVAVSTSASFGWSLKKLRQRWLSEVWRKIWGICRRRPGHCSVVMDRSVIGEAPVSCKMSRVKQHKTDIVNLKWDSNSISNRWCKVDVKFTSPITTWLQQMR